MFSSDPSFSEGVSVINAVDDARFPLLLGRVAQGLLGSSQAFSASEQEKLQVSLELEHSSLSLLLQSLNFILKQAAFNVAKPAVLRDQLLSSGLSEEKASACAQVWASVAKPTIDTLRQRSLYPLQLEAVKWSLGARLSSSSQSAQSCPTAKLQLHLSSADESSQQPDPITLQMDHSDLYQLFTQVEKVQAQLDALK